MLTPSLSSNKCVLDQGSRLVFPRLPTSRAGQKSKPVQELTEATELVLNYGTVSGVVALRRCCEAQVEVTWLWAAQTAAEPFITRNQRWGSLTGKVGLFSRERDIYVKISNPPIRYRGQIKFDGIYQLISHDGTWHHLLLYSSQWAYHVGLLKDNVKSVLLRE
ncbi:hypothetical protein BaRGS_00025717 [Batillaria attramentaria]|uniref:Uncharacterized protein n=1 Tax=Batillaria attramentaria TaxID=370345 RepID=A0ABD0K6T7_9CAEN